MDDEDVLKMLIEDGYDDDDDINFEIDSEAERRLLEGDTISSVNSSPTTEIDKDIKCEKNSSSNQSIEIAYHLKSNQSTNDGDTKNQTESNQNRQLLKRPYNDLSSNGNNSNVNNNSRNQSRFKRPRYPNKNSSINIQNEFFNIGKNMAFRFPSRRPSNSSTVQKSGPIYRFPSTTPSPSLLPRPQPLSNMPIDPILSADFFNNQNNDNFFQRPFSSCNSVMSPGYNGFPSAIIPNPFNPPPINIMPFLTNRSPFINDHQTPNESYIGFPTSNVNNNHLNNFKPPLISNNNIQNPRFNFPDHSNRHFNHNINNSIHPITTSSNHHGNSLLPDPPLLRSVRNLTVLNQSNFQSKPNNQQQKRPNFLHTSNNASNVNNNPKIMINNQKTNVIKTSVQNQNLKSLTSDNSYNETLTNPSTNCMPKSTTSDQYHLSIAATITTKETSTTKDQKSKPILRKKKKKEVNKQTQPKQNQIVIAEKVEEIKGSFGIDEEYMRKMEEQKRLREKIAQEKAEKRKIFQTVCSGQTISSQHSSGNINSKNLEQSTINPQIMQIKNVSPIKTPTPIAKTSSLDKTATSKTTAQKIKPSTSIQISGLAIDVRESLLRKITRPFGMVESIVFIEQQQNHHESKCAIVKFKQSNDAKKFMDNCHTDPTILTQTLMSDKLPTLSFINNN
ncbi:uncharacterized protein LOC124494253 isoform X6 [Dermatophagoides farinae]